MRFPLGLIYFSNPTGLKYLFPCIIFLNPISACNSFGGCFGCTCLLQAENLRPCPCREKSCARDNQFFFHFLLHGAASAALPHQFTGYYFCRFPLFGFEQRCGGYCLVFWDGPAVRGDLYKFKNNKLCRYYIQKFNG